jgi:hypothetical protein
MNRGELINIILVKSHLHASLLEGGADRSRRKESAWLDSYTKVCFCCVGGYSPLTFRKRNAAGWQNPRPYRWLNQVAAVASFTPPSSREVPPEGGGRSQLGWIYYHTRLQYGFGGRAGTEPRPYRWSNPVAAVASFTPPSLREVPTAVGGRSQLGWISDVQFGFYRVGTAPAPALTGEKHRRKGISCKCRGGPLYPPILLGCTPPPKHIKY